jgi:hypothetical protein
MAYARHQSFFVKENWINKGIKAAIENPSVFSDFSNYKELGIGKNMFISLKYWLDALNIISFSKESAYLTDFGKFILNHDLSCELDITLNLLQYFLTLHSPVNGTEMSHTFYWFFNINQDKIIRKSELVNELVIWDTSEFKRNTSENTIKRDVDCLLQTYTKNDKLHPEDKNLSILSRLNLLYKQGENYIRSPIKDSKISRLILMYMLLRMKEENISEGNGEFLELNEIIEGEMSPGRIFNMNRIDLIEIIDEMISNGFPLNIIRTNNLDTLIINEEKDSKKYLEDVFENWGNTKNES